jgi:dUTPase
MPVHKFITKHAAAQIQWLPKAVSHAPTQLDGNRWEMFAQTVVTITPRSSVTLVLGLGVSMARGMCFISLRQDLKEKRCSLQDGTVCEDVDNVIITIQNNSDSPVRINEGDSLCYVTFRI